MPQDFDELFLYDFLKLRTRITNRQEEKVKSQLRQMQLLIQGIHTSEPQTLVENLEQALEPTENNDLDIGDIGRLKDLQARRGA